VLAGKPEIAGPGFLNLRLAQDVWHKALREVWEQRDRFGRSNAGNGLRTMVEFVSANPTGPMHVGHGRGAVIGDVVANLLEWAGYDVFREFYINDAGGQVWRLDPRRSFPRQRAAQGRAAGAAGPGRLPGRVRQGRGPRLAGCGRRSGAAVRGDPRAAAEVRTTWILDNLIKPDLEAFGSASTTSSAKRSSTTRGAWRAHPGAGREGHDGDGGAPAAPGDGPRGGRVRSAAAQGGEDTRFGDDRDRPLFKTTGEPTYFAADVAYHFDKIARGHRRLIDVWGADHAGYVQRMKAAVTPSAASWR